MTISATAQTQLVELYIALLGRAPDASGLSWWANDYTSGQSLITIAGNMFTAGVENGEYSSAMTTEQLVLAVYKNVFNREGAAVDAEGLEYWVGDYATCANEGELVLRMINAAKAYQDGDYADPAINQAALDAQDMFSNRTDFGIWFATELRSNDVALADTLLDSITADPATVAAAEAAATSANGTTYTLTIDVDTIPGTSGNDTINGAYNTAEAAHAFSGLDTINGGAGVDTLNLTDSKGGEIDFGVATVSNVEILNVRSVGTIVGNAAANTLDLTDFAAGLTSATINVKQGAVLAVTAETTTALNVTNANEGVTIVGGGGALVIDADGVVTVGNNGAATADDINALTSVSVTQVLASNDKADITDNSGAAGAIGSKLTTVSLDGVGAASALTGDGINTLSLTNSDIAVTVVNTKAHTLGLTVNDLAAGAEVIDDTATAVNVTTTGTADDNEDSTVIIDAGKAATITVAGAGDVTLAAAGADYAALTTFNYTGSGSVTADLTGAAKLTSVVAGTATGDAIVTVDGAITSVTTGAGDDTVTIDGTTTTDFEGTLTLGAGSDTVAVANGGVITADAVVDAGADVDTLALSIVGIANVGAFKNFEQFDVAGLGTNFDQVVLNAKNSVTNFVGTDDVTAALTLQNLGAGVGFIVQGDMDKLAADVVTLTQATAGALTISTDVDGAEGDGIIAIDASFVASNATSITASFGNDNVDEVANTAELVITGTKATTLTIVSDGSEVTNTLTYTGDGDGTDDYLTSVTITGDQALVFTYTNGDALSLASVDASGQTDGGLTFTLADLTATGTLKLGAGDDVITATAITTTAATTSSIQTINGLELGSDAGLAAQDGFDVIAFAGAIQAGDVVVADAAGFVATDGLATFTGAGPANLAAAIALLDAELSVNEAVVFDFAGTYYIYGAGAAVGDTTDDMLVKLTGVTNVDGLDAIAAGSLYVY